MTTNQKDDINIWDMIEVAALTIAALVVHFLIEFLRKRKRKD